EAPPAGRGQAGGLYNACYYLGSSVGGAAGAVLYGHAGWAWLVAAVAGALTVGILAILSARRA
ncbi:hypothetical protein LY13_004086, partial [Prauserella aidingensis]|nr:hypothetical protein [Prauserella aidingensis]